MIKKNLCAGCALGFPIKDGIHQNPESPSEYFQCSENLYRSNLELSPPCALRKLPKFNGFKMDVRVSVITPMQTISSFVILKNCYSHWWN